MGLTVIRSHLFSYFEWPASNMFAVSITPCSVGRLGIVTAFLKVGAPLLHLPRPHVRVVSGMGY